MNFSSFCFIFNPKISKNHQKSEQMYKSISCFDGKLI